MRHSENVKIKFKKDNTLTIIIAAALLVGILMIVLKLGFMSVYATKGDELLSITDQRDRYVEMNKQLESQIAELQSVKRIQTEATTRLGMVKAKPVVYLDLDK